MRRKQFSVGRDNVARSAQKTIFGYFIPHLNDSALMVDCANYKAYYLWGLGYQPEVQMMLTYQKFIANCEK